MRIKGAKQVHYDSGPNMTPLVDVVMVILIFLMLTGSFGAITHFLPSSMPIKPTGKGGLRPDEVPKVPPPQLEIFVSPAGDGSMFRARVGSGNAYSDAESLKTELIARRKQHEGSGSTADKMQIVICPRLNTKFDHIIQVYQAAMAAEWPKIGFQSAKD